MENNLKEHLKKIYDETDIKNIVNKYVLIRKDLLKEMIIHYFQENNECENEKIKIKKDDLAIIISDINLEYRFDHIDKEDYTWMINLNYAPDKESLKYKEMLEILKLSEDQEISIDFTLEELLKKSLDEFLNDFIFRKIFITLSQYEKIEKIKSEVDSLIKKEFGDDYYKYSYLNKDITTLLKSVINDLFEKYFETYPESKIISPINSENNSYKPLIQIQRINTFYESKNDLNLKIIIDWSLINISPDDEFYKNRYCEIYLDELINVDFVKIINLKIFNMIDIEEIIEKRKLKKELEVVDDLMK